MIRPINQRGETRMQRAATKRAIDPQRYFESVTADSEDSRARAGLPLSGDDQPLQSAVHDLPAHLRGARAARRHELGAVHLDRRSDPAFAARGPARRRRADAGEAPAAHGALSEGSRHLCAVQHQRHRAQREERPRADRRRTGRAARLLRRGECQVLSRHSRQELFQPHPEKRARLPRAAGARGPRQAEGFGVADRLARNHRGTAGFRPRRGARPASRKCICSGWCFSPTRPSARRGRIRRCTSELSGEEAVHIDRAAALARTLGIDFSASGGASEPGVSLKRSDNGGSPRPGRCAGGRGR